MKFRIPRKKKKKIGNFLCYPKAKDGSSLMASPKDNQEDYTAYKQGILEDPFHKSKTEREKDSIEWNKKYKTPIEITDEELLVAVNHVFASEYRENAYRVLKMAKNHQVGVTDYHTFVNAYKLNDSLTACMSVDSAEENLKRSKPRDKNS